MRPFDLERALAGEPVVMKCGIKIADIAMFEKGLPAYPVQILAFKNDQLSIGSYTKEGKAFDQSSEQYDLYMAEDEEKEEMKHEPFNLERALAGDAVITRDGRDVIEIYQTKNKLISGENLFCIMSDGSWSIVYSNGEYSKRGMESSYDLFMKKTVTKYYVNLYKLPDGKIFFGDLQDSFYQSNFHAVLASDTFIKTIEITLDN